jgi:GT2 family glycosyltransferase
MTVYALMPVFNRLAHTQKMIECLRQQVADEAVSITLVDDGSTDGTGDFLQQQSDVAVLKGDGNLWWGGAIDLGLRHILSAASQDDWVMFVNNDMQLPTDFVQQLLDAARRHAPAAVGSVVRDVKPPHRLMSVGPRVDSWRFNVFDVVEETNEADYERSEVSAVDVLSGRGVLFPVAALRYVNGMRPAWLPHYLADYELSLRVRKSGWQLLVAHSAVGYSRDEFGSAYRAKSLRERLFSVRSPVYLPAQIRFWWEAASPIGKLTFPFRIGAAFVFRLAKAKLTKGSV